MNALLDWVNARRDRLTWLDSERYVRSVFAGSCEHWHHDPGTMIAAVAQAQTILRSDVLCVDLGGPFARYLGPDGDVVAALEREEPRRDLAATVDALLHRFGDDVAIVLDCPSPRRWLGSAAPWDALDDVATALLAVMRSVADRPLHGLQITCDTEAGPDPDELDSWTSLLAAARHYGWVTAIRLNHVGNTDEIPDGLPADLLLLPESVTLPDDRRLGGGLPPMAWTEAEEAVRLVKAAAGRGFRFGEIPHDAAPETVLARVTTLH
jgi:hypothetical protein